MAGPSPTFTLRDLESWSAPGTALAVVGFPIRHSISPVMHNAALAAMAHEEPRFATWHYHRFEIDPQDLAVALPLFRERGFLGLNLTVPHKVLALDHVAHLDPRVRLAGATNTLRAHADGWEGFNTDGHGLEAGVWEDLHLRLADVPIILLGAGGAARGAAVQCLNAGCRSLTVLNRTAANLTALCADLAGLAAPDVLRGHTLDNLPPNLPAGALVINATSAGLKPTDPLPLDFDRLPAPVAVYDMIYNPPETRWLAEARRRGLPTANGLSMLIHQGAAALALWAERPVPTPVLAAAARAALVP